MAKYRKKPVVIDAFRWTGGPDQEEDPDWIVEAIEKGTVWFPQRRLMRIETFEAIVTAKPGDWIIRGVAHELYPCRHDIFMATYELVEE